MFCPNCGANNNKKQKYCRFCGLNLQDTARSLISQRVFGEDSDLLKTLSSTNRMVDFAAIALIGVLIAGVAAYYFFAPLFGENLVKVSLAIFFLLKIIQDIIRYFQRRERSKTQTNKFGQQTEQVESKATVKFLEEKPFEPVPSAVENTTELLPVENKTRKFE